MKIVLQNLLTALALVGVIYAVYGKAAGLTPQQLAYLGGLAFLTITGIHYIWPPENAPIPYPVSTMVGVTRESCAFQQVMRQLMSEHIFYCHKWMSSFIDNHLDRQVWHELLIENAKHIGGTLGGAVGKAKGERMTLVCLHDLKAKAELLSALYSQNSSRVRMANKLLKESGAQKALAMSSLSSKLNLVEVTAHVKKCHENFSEMALARLQQNWLRDAKLFNRAYNDAMKAADKLTAALI